jgi:hypothetical protein
VLAETYFGSRDAMVRGAHGCILTCEVATPGCSDLTLHHALRCSSGCRPLPLVVNLYSNMSHDDNEAAMHSYAMHHACNAKSAVVVPM